MVVARTVKYSFKEGMRDDGFAQVDLAVNKKVRNMMGFRGYISLLSCDEVNEVTILTLWQDAKSFRASEEIFTSDVERLMPLLEKKPEVGYHRVDSVVIP